MRRSILVVASCALALTACSGSDGLSKADLAEQQDAADDTARTVVSTLVADLGGAAPSGDTLGRGLYAGCDGGDPDQASYFIDTFVTYEVRPAPDAAAAVKKALAGAGLSATVDAATQDISTSDGDITVDLSSQEKGGGSAGQNIFVSTGCLAIGKDAIAAFNTKNGRDVTP